MKSCICGYSPSSNLVGNLSRHIKKCTEYIVHERMCVIIEKFQKQEEERNILLQDLKFQLDENNLKIVDQQGKLNEKDKQIRDKDEQIRSLENALIQKPTYKNCNVSNTVNLCINAWGNETFDHITEEDKIRALRNYTTAIPNIIEQIHFGNERKNRNVKLPNKRGKEVLIHKEFENGEVKQVHEDLNEVLEGMIANGKYVLDPVAERLNMTRYKTFREDLRESERIKGKLYAEQKSAVKRKLMDNACESKS